MLNDPDPQVIIAVVPSVEGDLPNVPGKHVTTGPREKLHAIPQLPHKTRLAGTPVTQQGNGKRRLGGERGQHGGNSVHVPGDVERVLGTLQITDHLGQLLDRPNGPNERRTGEGVPPSQHTVRTAGDDLLPIGRHGHGVHFSVVPGQGLTDGLAGV